MHVVDKDAVGQRILAGEQGRPRRAADRAAGHGMGQVDALAGQAVDVGRLHVGVARVAGGLGAPLIGKDIDDVGTIPHRRYLTHGYSSYFQRQFLG